MRYTGVHGHAEISGEDQLPGSVNYLIGNDPSKWRAGISAYGKVKYVGLYPGVDLLFHGEHGRLEFDYQVAPGAGAKPIELQFYGASRLTIDGQGNLVIHAGGNSIRFQKPSIYQTGDGTAKHSVEGGFRLISKNRVGFAIGAYDHNQALVIDPIFDYSTYLGGSVGSNAVAVDANGNAYIAGWAADGLLTTPGAFQTGYIPKNGIIYNSSSAFVAKFNTSGTALVYCTYLGGTTNDIAHTLAVDSSGNVYVAGVTLSTDFPITAGAYQTANHNSSYTGFVSKLNSTGSALIYSTYLGGSKLDPLETEYGGGSEDSPNGIVVDADGNAYVAGSTASLDFPVTLGAFQTTFKMGSFSYDSGFVTKLNSTGTALVYSSYLGGTGDQLLYGVALDATNDAYVTGGTSSLDFPTTPGAFQTVNKAEEHYSGPATGETFTAFVTEFNASGTDLLYSTFVGGSFLDQANAIAVDSSGNAYITGNTTSADFPTTAGVFQPSKGQKSQNSFVSKLNSMGTGLVYSTYLGGSTDGLGGTGEDNGTAIALDSNNDAVVVGTTDSLDFPVTTGAFLPVNLSMLTTYQYSSFVSKVNATGTVLLYSTFFSGTGKPGQDYLASCDCIDGVALDGNGNAYVTGLIGSLDFPTTQSVYPDPNAILPPVTFLTKYDASEMTALSPTTTTVTANLNNQLPGTPITFTASVESVQGGSTPTGQVGFSFNQGQWLTANLDQSGNAHFTTVTLLQGGPNTIATTYLGDALNAPSRASTTETVTQTEQNLPVAIVATPSGNPVTYGTPISFNIAVQDPSDKGIPIGTVELVYNLGGVAAERLDTSGHAVITTSSLPPGTDRLDFNFYSSNTTYAGNELVLDETVTPLGVTPTPVISPPSGSYASDEMVTITDSGQYATISYIIGSNGEPTRYEGPFTLTQSETVQATAVVQGYSTSASATANYVLGPKGQVPSPILEPPSGSYSSTQAVYLTDALAGATIYYTTDGSTPSSASMMYVQPITVGANATIQAIASATGYFDSGVVSSTYVINIPPPDFSISISPTALTVRDDNDGRTLVTVTALNGFSQPVIFSCSDLPGGTTCTFAPTEVSQYIQGSATTTLTIQRSTSASIRKPRRIPFVPISSLAALLCALNFRKRRGIRGLIIVLGLTPWMTSLSACGAGGSAGNNGSNPPSNPVTSTITITGSSGSLQHSSNLTLTLD